MAVNDPYYSTVDRVKMITGIQPGDLEGIDSRRKLDSLIEEWLRDSKAMIDEYVGRDFYKEEQNSIPALGGDPLKPVPRAIHDIASRVAARAFQIAQKYRGAATTPETEEYEDDSLLSNRIRADLKLFRVTITDSPGTGAPRLMVINGKTADRVTRRGTW